MKKKMQLNIKVGGNFIKVYLNENLFFKQKILLSQNKFINNKVYTLFYVFKIMYRFGLIGPVSKKFGYR